jgi:hypothetical protein
MAKTITQCLVDGLLASGYTEVESKSGKYRAFQNPNDPNGYRMFVGKAGGLRKGMTVSASVGLAGTNLHRQLVARGCA